MPTVERPPASVVVATHGRPELLEACVDALIAACAPTDEIIIAASGDDGASKHLEGGQVRVLSCDDRRKDAKVNLGAAMASTDVIVLTDDDCLVAPGWIAGMASAFADPVVGVAFGPVQGLTAVQGGQPPAHVPPGPAPLENWTYAHGASMAVRRAALLDVGGFDERLGPGASAAGEEADLVVRMTARGWQCVIADAPVVNHVGWRDPEQEAANRLTYERGAGVWIGAGLRRNLPSVARLARRRLSYQRALYEDRRTRGWAFGPRTSLAFGMGLLEGMRMPPRRFVPPCARSGRAPVVAWIEPGGDDRRQALMAALRDRVEVRVVTIGATRQLEAGADLVIVDDERLERAVGCRESARWVQFVDGPRPQRRVAAYDGLIASSPATADAIDTAAPVWVWAADLPAPRAAGDLADAVLATLPALQRR